MEKLFNNRNFFCRSALILLLIGEICALVYIRHWWKPSWVVGVIILVLIFILFKTGLHYQHKFGFKSLILSKLLANAISPRPLGTAYLLAFVIHIGWLTNAVLNIFLDKNFMSVFLTVVVCFWGILVLILFFPVGNEKDNNSLCNIVISGLSRVFPTNDYTEWNLRPFVRIYQLVAADIVKVVLSDDLVKNGYLSPVVYVFDKDLPQFDDFEEGTIVDKKGLEHCVFLKRLGKIVEKTKNIELIKKDLELVIKEAARLEFFDKPNIIKVINACKIEFTDFISDYNNYQTSFEELNKLTSSLDTSKNQLYFNLTPGTITMSSIMTLLAVDGDRRLYYYSQDSSLPDELKLKEVLKTQIPLENLLSQALENVEHNKK